jgi:hypothetical protein
MTLIWEAYISRGCIIIVGLKNGGPSAIGFFKVVIRAKLYKGLKQVSNNMRQIVGASILYIVSLYTFSIKQKYT